MIETIRDAVASAENRSERKIKTLESRIAELEAKPNLAYRGTHEDGRAYKAGDAVSWQGSLWICLRSHVASNHGIDHDGTWQLAVKKGRDGRDAR
jgi:hypothetical protein